MGSWWLTVLAPLPLVSLVSLVFLVSLVSLVSLVFLVSLVSLVLRLPYRLIFSLMSNPCVLSVPKAKLYLRRGWFCCRVLAIAARERKLG
jgi:hypothetical protein